MLNLFQGLGFERILLKKPSDKFNTALANNFTEILLLTILSFKRFVISSVFRSLTAGNVDISYGIMLICALCAIFALGVELRLVDERVCILSCLDSSILSEKVGNGVCRICDCATADFMSVGEGVHALLLPL